ncbi:MAG: hypothetical protein ACK5LM_02415 [Lactovum sp.]
MTAMLVTILGVEALVLTIEMIVPLNSILYLLPTTYFKATIIVNNHNA